MVIKKRVTIKEVAQAAGVSTQTVSRVLNERPDVSEKTRQRILDIIADLDYSPNVIARSLIRGRSHTVGVVGYGLGYYGPSRVITGIERRVNDLGYSLLLSLLREPESNDGEAIFHSLLARQVDGIIWAIPEIGTNRDWLAEQLHRLSVPVVFINMHAKTSVPVVAVDNRFGGQIATEHLLQQGYRNIGIITGPPSWWEAMQRKQGWMDAMHAAGIEDLESLQASGDWYPSSGACALEELLTNRPDLEAVFACNDPMAAGALHAAQRLGRKVPQDLAIVGFDDVPEAAYYCPSLTTISQPLVELGGQAVDLLIRVLQSLEADEEMDHSESVWLKPQLVVRESSIRP
jgi:LacI family transcriptional regulator